MQKKNWEKYAGVIQRLSSRATNEQTQSSMIGKFCSPTPLCIETSFYECKNNIGKGCCVQMCGDCSDMFPCESMITSNGPQMSRVNKPLLDVDVRSSQHQFTLSKMFDNKRKYVDYVTTNVLRQVANHVSVEALHQLCCCLPQNIEDLLVNVTDIDCDRLVRILVTEVMQFYSSTANQLTDWYAFANLMKPLRPPSFDKTDNDNDEKTLNDSKSKIPPNLFKNESDSDHFLTKRTARMPVSPSPSARSIPSNEVDSPIGSDKMSSIGITPQFSLTSPSAPSNLELTRETTVPTGAGYQSRRKQKNRYTFDQLDDRVSAPRKSLINLIRKATVEELREQAQRSVSDEKRSEHHHRQHYPAARSNMGSNSSLNSDFVLTIHHERHGHRHKEAKAHNRHSENTSTSSDTKTFDHHYSKTSSFDLPSSERDGIQIHSSHLASSHSAAAAKKAVQQDSRESIRDNSTVAHSRTQDSDQTERLLILKLLALSDNRMNIDHHSQPSYLTSVDASPSIVLNEFKQEAQSVPTTKQTSYSRKIKLNRSVLDKKLLRINHYPNMLADFD